MQLSHIFLSAVIWREDVLFTTFALYMILIHQQMAWPQNRFSVRGGSWSHPLVEQLLDERFPEVLFDTFGLQHQTIVQLTQLLYEAVRPRRWPVVSAAEVLW